MKLNKFQEAYQEALVKHGVPELYAFMAARECNWSDDYVAKRDGASGLIIGGFWWFQSELGDEFWHALHQNALHLEGYEDV